MSHPPAAFADHRHPWAGHPVGIRVLLELGPRGTRAKRSSSQRDLVGGNARIDWDRTVVRTPKPLPFKYSEISAS